MKKIFAFVLCLWFCTSRSYAQNNVGINTQNPDPSAALDITSSAKGVLIPRMSKTERDAIPSPATGLMIFQNDSGAGFYYYNGTAWTAIGGGGGATIPDLTGNAGKVLTTNGSQLEWGSQLSAVSLYDGNNNRLGRVTAFTTTNYQIVTNAGYILSVGVNGIFLGSQTYWSGPNCTGTPYLNASGVRSGSFVTFSTVSGKLYKLANVVNNVATSATFPVASIETTSGCTSNGPTANSFALTEVTLEQAGLGFDYPFVLPLTVK